MVNFHRQLSKKFLKDQLLPPTSPFSRLRVCCCDLGLYCLRSRFSFYHFPVSAFVGADALYSAFFFEFCYLPFYSFLWNYYNFRQFIYCNNGVAFKTDKIFSLVFSDIYLIRNTFHFKTTDVRFFKKLALVDSITSIIIYKIRFITSLLSA